MGNLGIPQIPFKSAQDTLGHSIKDPRAADEEKISLHGNRDYRTGGLEGEDPSSLDVPKQGPRFVRFGAMRPVAAEAASMACHPSALHRSVATRSKMRHSAGIGASESPPDPPRVGNLGIPQIPFKSAQDTLGHSIRDPRAADEQRNNLHSRKPRLQNRRA